MSLSTTPLSHEYSVAPQISAEDVAEIAALGFKTIINNRPDLEGGEAQPTSQSIQAAANAAGLHYIHIPVIPNAISPADVLAFVQAYTAAPKPILGFCRTGNRAANLLELAMSRHT